MANQNTLDRQATQDVMLNYAAAVDDHDHERYQHCFAPQVNVFGFGEEIFRGREAWLGYVWPALEQYQSTQHLLGPQLVNFNDGIADTRNDVQAFHQLKNDSSQFILWATYHTQMQFIDGEWKITRHQLVVRGSKTQ
ncbi:nuclear transport factor 2 family protein [Oceanicoccus sp. KOV_DT_Chl]|uniref:nuclear transport factor 2 family protein n=1 Tax=Oceanicoccus sp. KOV_DT_Chl TaxID=1904639 RepID=UPI000C79985F|nr:nuclear transport factor 2 family protein [Oceanicoccus sp. KOV_DT_Chl]